MFGQRTRKAAPLRHEHQQSASPPPPGSDSCYNVRSLNSSMWSESQSPLNPLDPFESPIPSEADIQHVTDGTMPLSPPDPNEHGLSTDDSADDASSSQSDAPPSPDDTLRPLDRAVEDNGSTVPTADAYAKAMARDDRIDTLQARLSLAQLSHTRPHPHHHFHHGAHTESLPSSPASLASLSYVASLSSISRTSSPVSGIVYRASGEGVGLGVGLEEDAMDGLVVPTLSLPSSSLHRDMPLVREEGSVGIKVAVLGEWDGVQAFISQLGRLETLVDTGSGTVGIIRNGQVTVRILTLSSVDQVRRRINDGYAALDALLNPAPPRGSEEQVHRLAADYAYKNDWIHLVFVLDGDDQSLSDIAPVVNAQIEIADDKTPEDSRGATPSPCMDDASPMPSLVGCAGADSNSTGSSPSISEPMGNCNLATAFLRCITSPSDIAFASVVKFVSWRAVVVPMAPTPLDSSVTSASSSYGAQPPMPTVARASGRGEWEASLSRRVASAHAHARERERWTRAKKRDERDVERAKRLERQRGCGPLFPRTSRPVSVLASTGLVDIWSGVFGPKASSGWRWGVVAAVALAVGLGFWAGTR